MAAFLKKVCNFLKVRTGNVLCIPYTLKCRRRIQNREFTILCPTCIGGDIYHRLGMKFLSPTVNMWFYQKDFIKFISNLQYYLSQELRFVQSEYSFPVGMLDDIKLMFNHSRSEDEAGEAWDRRKKRIRFDNIYIIIYMQLENQPALTREELQSLKNVPCKRLIVLSRKELPDFEYVKAIQRSRGNRPYSYNFLDLDITGKRAFEKQFDFISWLNDEQVY